MAIRVAHSGNVAPAAVGSFGGGLGRRQKEDADRALSHLEHQQRLDAQKASQANSLNAAAAARRSAERDRGTLRDERREDLDYELSERQRAKHNQLSEAYEDAVSSGNFSEIELQDLEKEIIRAQAGLTSAGRIKSKSPYPEGQNIGQVWTSDDGRFLLSRDSKGDIKKVSDTNAKPTFSDRIKAGQVAMSAATGGVDGVFNQKVYDDTLARLLGPQETLEEAPADTEVVGGVPEEGASPAAIDQSPANTAMQKLGAQLQTILGASDSAGGVKSVAPGKIKDLATAQSQLAAAEESFRTFDKNNPGRVIADYTTHQKKLHIIGRNKRAKRVAALKEKVAELNHEKEMVLAKMKVMKARSGEGATN
jgi:hypothetical protein